MSTVCCDLAKAKMICRDYKSCADDYFTIFSDHVDGGTRDNPLLSVVQQLLYIFHCSFINITAP